MDDLSLFPDDTPKKQCTGPCGRTLDATPEYFALNKAGKKDKFRSKCKECNQLWKKEYLSRPETQEKRREQIKNYRNRPDVKEHLKAQNRKYQAKQEAREKKRAYDKEHFSRPDVKERKQEYRREYLARPDVKKRTLERRKERDAIHEVKERKQKYHKDRNSRPEIKKHRQGYHKEYISRPQVKEIKRVHSHNYRAHKKSITGTHTLEQIQDQMKRQKHKCYYCHARFKKTKGKYICHIEHTFPVSRVVGTDIPANDISYLVLACPACNLSKNDKFPWEWPEGGRLL